MLVKLLTIHPSDYHITVEDVETGVKYAPTCPLAIFKRIEVWGIGTIMDVTLEKNVVKNVVRRDPIR